MQNLIKKFHCVPILFVVTKNKDFTLDILFNFACNINMHFCTLKFHKQTLNLPKHIAFADLACLGENING